MGFSVVPQTAWAEPRCGAPDRTWVQVLAGTADTRDFEAALRAELASRRIDLCAETGGHVAPPVATVTLHPHEGAASIEVQVSDAVTSKRVERDVDLGAIAVDGRALALALAADELLRASWAELALATAPPPRAPVPEAVSDSIAVSARRPPEAPHASVGVAGSVEHFAGGQTLYGPDLQGSFWLARRVAIGARLGLREAPSVSAPDGLVRASSFLAGLEGSVTMTPARWGWGLDAVARVDYERVSYLAVPVAGATASEQATDALLLGGGARLFWSPVWPLRLAIEAAVEGALRPVEAADAGRSVVAVEGVGVACALAARAVF